MMATHPEARVLAELTTDELVTLTIARAERLGWRTISVERLGRVARGDFSAVPRNPGTLPRSAFGHGAQADERYAREHGKGRR